MTFSPAFQQDAFQNNAFQVSIAQTARAIGWIDDDRRRIRDSLTAKQLNELLAARQRPASRDLNREYDEFKNYAQFCASISPAAAPLERLRSELKYWTAQHDRAVRRSDEETAKRLQQRVMKLRDDIYKLKLQIDQTNTENYRRNLMVKN